MRTDAAPDGNLDLKARTARLVKRLKAKAANRANESAEVHENRSPRSLPEVLESCREHRAMWCDWVGDPHPIWASFARSGVRRFWNELRALNLDPLPIEPGEIPDVAAGIKAIDDILRWAAERGYLAGSPDKPRGRPRKGRISVNDRMKATIESKPESIGWTCAKWAEYLYCAASAVVATDIWDALKVTKADMQIKKLKQQLTTMTVQGKRRPIIE